MACVMPGARNLEEYWENIVHGVSAVGDPPPEWGADRCLDAGVDASDRIYCARGGYLGELAAFAPVEYGVMPSSVDGGEPDHFLALKAAFEALADAGYAGRQLPRDRVEVIIGRGSYVNRGNTTAIQHGIVVDQVLSVLAQLHPEHTSEELARVRTALKASLPPFHAETAPALVPNVISGRIANRLDFMGPNFIVDAACASSLVAVDLGVRDLLSGRCDVAVVGGVHASTPPVIMMIFCQLKAISRSGAIRPFDEGADGTLLGEGVGMVVLKRLRDAERDGDRVYAIVKGVGTASDGRALGLLAPRVEGEELALRRAYAAAEVDPATVGLIEAHGTATPVGDAVEIDALKRVFGGRRPGGPAVALGTVKSMISHLMPASGIAGLIKVALALHHKVLPPTINCERPDPKLGLDESPFFINTATRPWIHGGTGTPRRAGVNAFGFGGINAHAVMEEYAGPAAPGVSLARRWDAEVFIVSAGSREGLVAEGERLAARLPALREVPLVDLACTVNTSRPLGSERLGIVATSVDDLERKLRRGVEKLRDPKTTRVRDLEGLYYTSRPLAREGTVAWVFPGEGSQYPHMLADLCMHFPAVRSVFDLMDRAFAGHRRGYLPSQVVFPPPGVAQAAAESAEELIWRMDAGAEAVFAANQALAALLSSLIDRPHAVVGHSTGEHSALLVSGVVSVGDEAELMSHIKGVNGVFELHEQAGEIPEAMLVAAGGASLPDVHHLVERMKGQLFVAMDNCPHQVVLCGTRESAAAAIEHLQQRRAICQTLPFGRPYHTPWFDFFCGPLREYFERVTVRPSATDLYSCVTASRFPADADAVRDLVSVQWSRPVRFRETVEAMHGDGVRLFVEVGPRNTLTGFIDDTLRGKPYVAVASNVEHRSGLVQLNHLVAQLAVHGVGIRFDPLYARRSARCIDLEAPPRAAAQKGPTVRIATALQPVSLPADFRLGPGDAPPQEAGAASALHAGGNGASRPIERQPTTQPSPPVPSPAVSRPVPAATPTLPPARPVSRTPPSASLPARVPGSSVMRAHLQTMGQFLEVQSRVTTAFLKGRTGGLPPAWPGRGTAVSAAAPAVAGTAGSTPAAARSAVSAPPLLGVITSHEPGCRLTAIKRFSIDDDPFLRDHTLGRDISADDPELLALPVVPLTMTMELLAEAGAVLQPGRVLTGMREVRAYRWIMVDAPVELEVSARCRDGEPWLVDVSVREARSEGAPAPRLAEAVLVYADRRPEPVTPPPFSLQDEQPSRWTRHDLYARGMFHGPRFRGVEAMTRTGADGTCATMSVLPRHDLLRDDPEPAFVTDPVLLDAAGQVVAFWVMERFDSRTDIFPYRLEALELDAGGLPPGTRVECRVRATAVSDDHVRSDIDLVDTATGRRWCRFAGWEDRRFEVPRSLIELRCSPATAYVADAWDAPVAELPEAGGLACVRIAGFTEDLLDAHGGLWQKMLAHLVLSRQERDAWRQLEGTPRRRREWLLGRCAAKDAVRRLLARHGAPGIRPADVIVLADRQGRPEVHGAWKRRLGTDVAISISHKAGTIAAMAALGPSRKPGIDVESASAFPADMAALSFDDHERALAARLASAGVGEPSARFWCAKEAVSKALGRGLEAVVSDLRVVDLREPGGWVTVSIADSRQAAGTSASERVTAIARRDRDVVWAAVVL
jgi:acyl transferase domain-containing protein/phosphopantetheinyl transferase (holo-ACP synthase)